MVHLQQHSAKNAETTLSQVVTGTCSGAGDTDILTTMRFTVVVLDEATQSTEPSTLIPLVRLAAVEEELHSTLRRQKC